MTRHLYTIKANARDLKTVLSALARALAEADADVFEANCTVSHFDTDINRHYLSLAEGYKHEVAQAFNLFSDLIFSAEDEEGNYPNLQEAM